MRLLQAAKKQGNEQLYLLMETLGSTGMRISELQFVTTKALKEGFSVVRCKGKSRTALLTQKLQRALRAYCRKRGICSGAEHERHLNRLGLVF